MSEHRSLLPGERLRWRETCDDAGCLELQVKGGDPELPAERTGGMVAETPRLAVVDLLRPPAPGGNARVRASVQRDARKLIGQRHWEWYARRGQLPEG